MNKDQFNKLDIKKQVDYINKQLENNNSITSVCKDLCIGRSTISDRFKKNKYTYNKDLKKYIDNSCNTAVIKDIKKIDNSCNTAVECIENKNNIVNEVINLSTDDIKNNLLALANDYDIIKELIQLHRRNTSVVKQQIVINIDDAESKLTTLRVNSKVLESFNKFCDNNKQFKKIDLLSQALKNFIDQYS